MEFQFQAFLQHNNVPLCFCMLISSINHIWWYGHVLMYDHGSDLCCTYIIKNSCLLLTIWTHTPWNQSLETCHIPPWMTSHSRYVYERWVRKGQRGIPGGYWCECRLLRSNLQPWLGEHAYRQLVCKEICVVYCLGGGFIFFFTPIWGRFPIWLLFFRWVETTNQSVIGPPKRYQWPEGGPCRCDRQVSGGLAGLWQAPFYHPCELRLGHFQWVSCTDVQLH